MTNYIRPERIWLKTHPTLNEKWVQSLIGDEPAVLGLGDLVLRDKERPQPNAGRLDLLLQDTETNRRYEVELQLGATDESHIIRTIEYWDIERKRYPQYDHCAVLIAEDVTSRFLNVISILNGTVPLIAIQMQALNVGENMTVVFTTVVDELIRGLVDEDEEAQATPTDRPYWEIKASKDMVSLVDEMLGIVRTFDSSLTLKYNKHYIGLGKDNSAFNFITFRPKKNHVNVEIKLPRSEEIDSRIDAGDLERLEYSNHWGRYRIAVTKSDVNQKRPLLTELMKMGYDLRKS